MGLLLALILVLAASAPKPSVNTKSDHVALRAYDAVAYFTDGRAVAGLEQFELTWNGAIWRFANADHRDAFHKNPEHFAPQFGGYCAWAVAHDYVADGDPEIWKIVDGRLYLNYSKRAQRKWETNIPGYIRQGLANWPAVLNK
jgi:hypothetical protein